jgi:hypothetical protein
VSKAFSEMASGGAQETYARRDLKFILTDQLTKRTPVKQCTLNSSQ